MEDRQECAICGEKTVHPERSTLVCLDCIARALIDNGYLPSHHQGKALIRFRMGPIGMVKP
jgi:hypothetical protein